MFASMLRLRCPRCRQGKLFTVSNPYNLKRMNQMPERCPACGQDFEIEPGFYFGATYVSYALNVAWLVPTFLITRFVIGWEYRTFVIIMFALLPILVPLIFRVSRSIWLHFFVRFDPEVAHNVAQQPRSGDQGE